jgi:hypothetical protein
MNSQYNYFDERNETIFERNEEDNSMNLFMQNKLTSIHESDNEEDDLIYKSKVNSIVNNNSDLITAEMTHNNLSVPNNNNFVQNSNNIFNNNDFILMPIAEMNILPDSNKNYLVQNTSFIIPSVPVNHNQEKKMLGRKKKNSDSFNTSNRNKFSKDNLIHKFKTIFYQKFLINLTNNLISINLGKDSKIRKVNSDFIKDLTINLNLEILQKTLADYFSFKISKKYTKQEENSNEKIINNLKKILKSQEKFNKLLNTKIEDLYKIFIQDDCVKIIYDEFHIDLSNQEMNSLNYFLDKEEDPAYKLCLENACKNIYTFFDKQKARKILK